MVSGLIFKNSDPQNKGRGRGYYYYRGALLQPNGRRIKTWSKYEEKTDGAKFHKRTKVRNPNEKNKNQPHKGDYKTKVRGRKTTRLPKTRVRGYF